MDCGAIEFQENRVIIKEAKNFNIKQTFECGQCFRWEKINDNNFIGVAYGRVLEVIQEGENIILENTNKEEKGAFKIQMLKMFSCPNSKSKLS